MLERDIDCRANEFILLARVVVSPSIQAQLATPCLIFSGVNQKKWLSLPPASGLALPVLTTTGSLGPSACCVVPPSLKMM